MSLGGQLCLQNETAGRIGPVLHEIRQAGQLLDVTLVCEDGTAVEAHKLVLSAYSSVFRRMLAQYHHQTQVSCRNSSSFVCDVELALTTFQSLVFLPGVSSQQITRLLDFLYTGETSVDQQQVSTFLRLANQFDIKDLCSEQNIKGFKPTPTETGEVFEQQSLDSTQKQTEGCWENADQEFSAEQTLEELDPLPMDNVTKLNPKSFLTDQAGSSFSELSINSNQANQNQNNKLEDKKNYAMIPKLSSELQIKICGQAAVADGEIVFEPKDVLKNPNSPVWKILYFKGTLEGGPDKTRVYCKLCFNDFESKGNLFSRENGLRYNGGVGNLTTHYKNGHPTEWSDEKNSYNDVQDPGLASLLDSMFRRNPGKGRYQCNSCSHASNGAALAREHAETHLDSLSFPCRVCPSVFKSSRGLRSHRITGCQQNTNC